MDNQTPNQVMPAAVAYVLSHRLPCAALMLVMMMAAVWLPVLLQGLPPFLIMLIATLGLGLHILTPALIALITFGGGLMFGIHVAALAAVGVTVLAGFAVLPGLMAFVVYGLIPIAAAATMMRNDGVKRSAQLLALLMGALVFFGLMITAMMQDLGLREFIGQMLMPMFDEVQTQMPASDVEARQMLEQARQTMISVLPGLLALGLWFAWWGDMVFARNIALRYNFYTGDASGLLDLRLGKAMAYAFLGLLLLTNLGAGDLSYFAANAAILSGGLLATQGVAVVHSWLKAKGLNFSIALMYLMLLIWSVMIVPFVIVGLLDIWFDYRRNIPAAGG
ncbi:hypothetical protein MMIC_P0101 [Mariprofundus micogutta]|uniref:DUF2232 domain-containing protein n=1 Tax=Mariprofundus micogutta TaxID=1921010 RepID=A0A1L8CJT1_9PROT|nr:DUF2232 domain-containing protein [Mariprofundus micogutta]GAV19172.1 hypothetical protein MMIC_P0101 [Mariprofundus micogutta]